MRIPRGKDPDDPSSARRTAAGWMIGAGFFVVVVSWGAVGYSAEPAITLPKFVVSDSLVLPQPEAWRYAAIPGFEILSNASDRATVRMWEPAQSLAEHGLRSAPDAATKAHFEAILALLSRTKPAATDRPGGK